MKEQIREILHGQRVMSCNEIAMAARIGPFEARNVLEQMAESGEVLRVTPHGYQPPHRAGVRYVLAGVTGGAA